MTDARAALIFALLALVMYTMLKQGWTGHRETFKEMSIKEIENSSSYKQFTMQMRALHEDRFWCPCGSLLPFEECCSINAPKS